VTFIVLAVVLLLCGGGSLSAYLLLRNADGAGAGDPQTAATDFLDAVYEQQSARRAADLVCSAARNRDEIAKKVDEIKRSVRAYKDPRFVRSELTVQQKSDERALVATTMTLVTGDDRIAEQKLRLTVVHKTGWRVCEVESS
jgi:hypothetical protein